MKADMCRTYGARDVYIARTQRLRAGLTNGAPTALWGRSALPKRLLKNSLPRNWQEFGSRQEALQTIFSAVLDIFCLLIFRFRQKSRLFQQPPKESARRDRKSTR